MKVNAGQLARTFSRNVNTHVAHFTSADYTYPGRFGDAQLGMLQRKVEDRYDVMAKGLVCAASDEPVSERSDKVELVLVGVGNRS